MNIKNIIANNDLVQEESSVWLLKQHNDFGYSDGVESEMYLESVFRRTKDLSSSSSELENHIKDWPSEYHLSVKRAQLFSGFDFDPSWKVLEVGCGCGAITRYLGETFSDVVSVEGSLKRARLARLRTKDLKGVSIICAPFHEIEFTRKFDIIYCVGVYEYSASFVSGEDPYDTVLSFFCNMLTPKGIVIIAIENQFGLKYFNLAREDHTGTLFEGIEGYHAHGNKVKTFGKNELEGKLSKYFSDIKFYYPYPDYKLPNCVISEDFLASGNAGELVSQIRSRDYSGDTKNMWDEAMVSLELSKNGMLPFFSNSFLILSSKSQIAKNIFNQLAVLFSSQRTKKFRTQTRIYNDENGTIKVFKKPLSGDGQISIGKLNLVESNSTWKNFHSLHSVLYGNCMSRNLNFSDMFFECNLWVNFLENVAELINGEKYLDGKYIDCVFSNIYIDKKGLSIIDKEWVWKEKIRFNVVIIRSIFTFLRAIENARHLSDILKVRSLKRLIFLIADNIGVKLHNRDFSNFIILESEFQALVRGSNKARNTIMLKWILFDRPSFNFFQEIYERGHVVNIHLKRFFSRFLEKFRILSALRERDKP